MLLSVKPYNPLRTLFSSLLFCAAFCPMHAQELQKIAHLSYDSLSLAGCWHHVDSSGGEWGLIGTSAGMSIVDVHDPTHPVERFKVPGLKNNWRELRTWAGFAYVGSEEVESGITIVDLRQLPDTIHWKVWRGDGIYENQVSRSHTVQTADGHLYIFGSATIAQGAIIADLQDPWNPEIIGTYANEYVHDGYIRGDTMWTNEIKKGWFGVVDITDKSQPKLITTQPTPGAFNHNSELSPEGNILFTTDEKTSAPLGAFDVSNLDDITLLDTYLPSKKPEGEVHNVRVFGDFLIAPSYRGQLTIVDATRPANLIETAWDSLGNSLVWDADPYLPSGIILATAKAEGLFIYKKPAYRHACWLEGNVINGATGFPLSKAKVFVLATLNADTSRNNGTYKTGAGDPGLYDVYAFREGFEPATISGVSLQSNQVTQLDITLFPLLDTKNPEHNNFVKVSPSPFEDYLRVEFPEDSPLSGTNTTIRLFDFSGKMMIEKKAGDGLSTTIEGLKDLPKGNYWLLTSNGKGVSRGIHLLK